MSEELKEKIIEAIKTVHDPEIPINIYDLGLIYEIDEIKPGVIKLIMTLTTPNCPVAGSLPMEVQTSVLGVDGVEDVEMQVVFDPPWTKDRMSEEARFALDMF
jgi:FeS assembly SUF system protein